MLQGEHSGRCGVLAKDSRMLGARKLMRIGQMSKQTGVSIDAIRFYERSRLLGAPTRSEGGFRLYSSDDRRVAIHS